MVLLLLFVENRFYSRYRRVHVMTFLVNKVVTRSSVSAIRSAMMTRILVAESNKVALGNPSSNRTSVVSGGFWYPQIRRTVTGPDIKGTSKAKHPNIAHRF